MYIGAQLMTVQKNSLTITILYIAGLVISFCML